MHMLKAVRYEVENKGILTAVDDYFNDNTAFGLIFYFEDELPGPNIDMRNTKSYFTMRGNRKFKKAIRKLIVAYQSKGLRVSRIEKEIPEDAILYKDTFQVVVAS